MRGLLVQTADFLCRMAFVCKAPGALSSNGGRDFGAVLDALADAGALDIAWRILDARWFGVAQRRRRLFLVADFAGERAGAVLAVREGGGGDSEEVGEAGEEVAHALRASTGSRGTDDPDRVTFIPMLAGTFTGVRRLTPLECERLMGFPDGHTAGQAESHRYRQLGNAVVVPVAEWIGHRLVRVDELLRSES